MAAQTLTTVSNFDSALLSGLLNGEAITVNGGALTIDGDVRWNQNAAVFGSLTVSATLGGSILFDGRNVWELPYTAASGNVPAQAALGSNGVTGGTSGATGELLRVWANGSLTPATAGGAMPAAGWIKLRSKSGAFSGGEVVTLPGGATITISGPGKRSWLHMVGAENATLTWARLGDVKWRGDWHELGTTSGADDQTFQYPVADLCAAMWVEKYPGAYAVLGEFGLEAWLNAGPRWNTGVQQVSTDVRGKYFGQVATTGVITIAQRVANSCGFKPAAGLKVFIPNVILSCSNNTNWALNTVHATLASRYEIATTQGAVVDMEGCSGGSWYINASSASAVSIKRSGFLDGIALANIATPPVLEDFAVGLSASTTGYAPATLTSIYYGMTMTRVRMVRVVQGTFSVWTDVYGLAWNDVQLECFGASGSAARTAATTLVCRRVSRGVASSFRMLGIAASLEASTDLVIENAEYADNLIGTTGTAIPVSVFSPNAGAKSVHIKGFKSFGDLPNVHTYGQIVSVTAGATDTVLSDVGTPADPYDCGSANAMGSAVNASGTLGVTLRRVYLANNRLEPVAMTNTVDTVDLVNVWGSTSATQIFDGNTVTAKGCKWSLTTAAQSAVYGTHWQDQFTSDTAGAITIFCNEPSAASAANVQASFSAGLGWTAAGSVALPNVGDSVTWTMPYFALGHTALDSGAPVVLGTNVANHQVEFQADTGSGFGPWADLTGANLAAVGAINPATGVKLKVRATTIAASPSNLLTYLRIYTSTDAVSQQIQYPLPGVLTTLMAQVPLTGAEIRIYDLDNAPIGSLGSELAGTESAGSTFTFDTQAGNSVWIQVMAPGYIEYGQQFTVPSTNTTLGVILQPELNN